MNCFKATAAKLLRRPGFQEGGLPARRLWSLAGKMCCLALSLLAVLVSPGSGNALYAELHALLAYEASFVRGVPGEILSFAGDPALCTDRASSGICNGAYDEDADRDPRLGSDLGSWVGLLGWGTHFWDPAGGPHGGRLMNVGGIPINIDGENAYERSSALYDSARSLYPRDPSAAYHILGKVAHLLTDMATPAHVHRDPHISDYDSTGDDSFEEFTAARYVRPGMSEGMKLLEADIPPASLAVLQAADLPDGGHPEEPSLFRLFLSMATAAVQYDSDDVDGLTDKGGRRGVSVPYSYDRFLSAGAYAAGTEYPLPSSFYQVSAARKKFILSSAGFGVLAGIPSVEGIRLHFEEGEEMHPLSAFSRTDIGDAALAAVNADLLPAAERSIGSLYRLFWADVHPSVILDEAAEIRLDNGLARLEVISPAPLEISLDLTPKGWVGIETEVYIWASVSYASGTGRFYYDGTWKAFDAFSDLKSLSPSYRLGALHNAVWRVFDDSSALEGMFITFTVCVDRALDGSYSPAESVCGALPVSVRRAQ